MLVHQRTDIRLLSIMYEIRYIDKPALPITKYCRLSITTFLYNLVNIQPLKQNIYS